MNVSAPFICRPIATTLLVVAIVLLGGLGYRFLSVAALPTVEFPTIQVVTNWPGAAPDIVQSAISAPLEAGFGRIPGLALMTSTSSFGTSQITLQFKLTRPIAAAAQDVQAAINAAAGWLPMSQLPFPPTYHRSIRPTCRYWSSRSRPKHCRCTRLRSSQRQHLFRSCRRWRGSARSRCRAVRHGRCACRSTRDSLPLSACPSKTFARPSPRQHGHA